MLLKQSPYLHYTQINIYISHTAIRKRKYHNKEDFAYSNNRLLAGVNDTDGLVLAGGADKATISVPAHVVDDIWVHFLQVDHSLSCAHIPDDDLVVTT